MDNLTRLLKEREDIKTKIKDERTRVNGKLWILIKERLRLNVAISRAKFYKKRKKV